MTSSVAVVLASSDNTVDVGSQIAKSIDLAWADCPYDRYVVLSTAAARWDERGWQRLDAGRSDGWRNELTSALRQLGPAVEYIILILDDFLLLSPVNTPALAAVIDRARCAQLGYVRLKPVERSWLVAWCQHVGRTRIQRLRPTEPYPSSLQITLWRRDHLLRMLALPGTIWDFEHQLTADEPHYAIAGACPFHYRHVVERGRWLSYARQFFARAGLPFEPGQRPVWSRSYMAKAALGRFRFGLFGYLPMRLKQVLRCR